MVMILDEITAFHVWQMSTSLSFLVLVDRSSNLPVSEALPSPGKFELAFLSVDIKFKPITDRNRNPNILFLQAIASTVLSDVSTLIPWKNGNKFSPIARQKEQLNELRVVKNMIENLFLQTKLLMDPGTESYWYSLDCLGEDRAAGIVAFIRAGDSIFRMLSTLLIGWSSVLLG